MKATLPARQNERYDSERRYYYNVARFDKFPLALSRHPSPSLSRSLSLYIGPKSFLRRIPSRKFDPSVPPVLAMIILRRATTKRRGCSLRREISGAVISERRRALTTGAHFYAYAFFRKTRQFRSFVRAAFVTWLSTVVAYRRGSG